MTTEDDWTKKNDIRGAIGVLRTTQRITDRVADALAADEEPTPEELSSLKTWLKTALTMAESFE